MALWARLRARRARERGHLRGLSRLATAAALAAHLPEHGGGWCSCGARFTPLHQAAVLDAAGLVLVLDVRGSAADTVRG